MRWDRLFDDLEAEWEAGHREATRAEVADRTRRERATVTLVSRLTAQAAPVDVLTVGGRRVSGRPIDVGNDFVVLAEAGGRHIVPLWAIVQVIGLEQVAAGPAVTAAVRRFGLGSALRAVARDRSAVLVSDVTGCILTGTIDAVGADFLELLEHPLDLPPRQAHVRSRRVLPFASLIAISSTR